MINLTRSQVDLKKSSFLKRFMTKKSRRGQTYPRVKSIKSEKVGLSDELTIILRC